MPPQDRMLTGGQKPTDIYSVMLILASLFLLLAIVLTWHELDDHYKFMGSGAAAEAPADEPTEPTEPTEAEDTAAPSAE